MNTEEKLAEALAALQRIKEIGMAARFGAPRPEQDWKNAVVRMEREAEETLGICAADTEADTPEYDAPSPRC